MATLLRRWIVHFFIWAIAFVSFLNQALLFVFPFFLFGDGGDDALLFCALLAAVVAATFRRGFQQLVEDIKDLPVVELAEKRQRKPIKNNTTPKG
uniref:Uncharacterized protein n=1 Tax=Leersia perrieri TaxID=77586 RepID=A0A0D9W4R0_9ORYZ